MSIDLTRRSTLALGAGSAAFLFDSRLQAAFASVLLNGDVIMSNITTKDGTSIFYNP